MSRIGKKPVVVKMGVSVTLEKRVVVVRGQKGSSSFSMPEHVDVAIEDGKVFVSQKKEWAKEGSALFGLSRAMIANMIKGVSEGFEKKLELFGVGYRAQVSGNDLVLSVGFSHPVRIPKPSGITFSVAENVITVFGTDKTLVGDASARIRAIRPPEPYKGKGIRYLGEKIRRKAGKAAKAVGVK